MGNMKATSSIMDRYLGYYRAMLVNSLPVRDEWILMDRTDDGELIPLTLPEDAADRLCVQLRHDRPEADRRAAGKGIPGAGGYLVTGFDDFRSGRRNRSA